jgi:hypothetical protein
MRERNKREEERCEERKKKMVEEGELGLFIPQTTPSRLGRSTQNLG